MFQRLVVLGTSATGVVLALVLLLVSGWQLALTVIAVTLILLVAEIMLLTTFDGKFNDSLADEPKWGEPSSPRSTGNRASTSAPASARSGSARRSGAAVSSSQSRTRHDDLLSTTNLVSPLHPLSPLYQGGGVSEEPPGSRSEDCSPGPSTLETHIPSHSDHSSPVAQDPAPTPSYDPGPSSGGGGDSFGGGSGGVDC